MTHDVKLDIVGQASARRITLPPHCADAVCLGCNERPDFTFQIKLKSRSGQFSDSQVFGCCKSCVEPGKPNYEQLRQRVGFLLWQASTLLASGGGQMMSDKDFFESLQEYLMRGEKDRTISPSVPIFRKADGSIDREKTLALDCFDGYREKES
jgi:hypothetical protein